MKNGFYGRPAMMGSSEYPGRTLQDSYPFHFSPHLGLAYQIRNGTVARLSYGMNWMSLTGNIFLNTSSWNNAEGGSSSIQRGTTNNGLTYGPTFQTPMPGGVGYIPYARGSESTILNTAL